MAEPVKLELAYRDGGEPVRVPLPEGHLRIGRRSRCELWLADRSVSKIHAFVSREGDGVTVEDAKSHNGTFVNGRRIAQTDVSPGDVIRVGRYRLHLLYAGAPVPAEEDLAPPKPRWDPTALVLAGLITALVGLGVGAVLKGALDRPAPPMAPSAAPEGGEAGDGTAALAKGAEAYVRGDLAEAHRFLRTSDTAAARALLAVVDAELADLGRDPRAIDWEQRAILLQRLIRADPPPAVGERARAELQAIEAEGRR